jgi:lactate dehydrogenase-like 2-hydroxyacid dehydrogenase
MNPTLLQLCPLIPYLEEQLAHRFKVVRWFDEEEQDDWLGMNSASVVAVVTGGHLGISNALMNRLPSLGIVAINGVGFDKVDLAYARARKIRVSSTPGVLTDDVADLAVGLIIALLRGISVGDQFVRSGRWKSGEMALTRRVSGLTFGILGMGSIGQAIGSRLQAFGPIVYSARSQKDVPWRYVTTPLELAAASDVLVVSASANASTQNIVGAAVLSAIGPEGYLVNVARGSLVDEVALTSALSEGRLAGAALDVFAHEPNVPAALAATPNVVMTPHIGSATKDARRSMADLVLQNLDAFVHQTAMPSALV